MIKIDIISGFLGAGKTTLISKLLEESLKNEQVVLIENEFGEIGIDGGFLKSAGIDIREMNSGCICCSLVGDFGTALQEVFTTYHPDRVIIEPSGVGKLSDVIKAVKRAEDGSGEEAKINCATAVVDVLKCRSYLKNFGEFYEDQIEAARTIILTRTDLPKATQEKVEETVALIRQHNADATIVTTPIAQLSGDALLKVMEQGGEDLAKQMLDELDDDENEEHDHDHHRDHACECAHDHDHDHAHDHHHDHACGCGHHHHHHDADEVFTSWGRETIRKFSKEELEKILQALSESGEYGQILRAKGIVTLTDGSWAYFDMVPEQTEIRAGEPEFTGRLCVIGAQLDEDKISELFGMK